MDDIFPLAFPEEILQTLARMTKKRRLEKGLSREALQSLTGVPAPTIARFESTSRISLESFVRIALALGYQDEMKSLLMEDKYTSMDELETIKKNKNRQRGKRSC